MINQTVTWCTKLSTTVKLSRNRSFDQIVRFTVFCNQPVPQSGPDKVPNGPPVSFSPTHFSPQSTLQPFSPEIFSPSKVTNSPAHSSPPQQHAPPPPPPSSGPPTASQQQQTSLDEGQNNSSYGSHEDTLTFEVWSLRLILI